MYRHFINIIDTTMFACFLQMEELVGTRHPDTSHDLLLLLHHLPGPHGAYDDCEYLFYHKCETNKDFQYISNRGMS